MLSCNLVFLSVKEPLGKHKAVTVLGKQGWNQARSQDFFFVGGGGGENLKNRDQIMNVLNDTLC